MSLNEALPALYDYCEKHSASENTLLQDLTRETHLKTLSPRMLSGHLQGRFLSLIAKLMRPQCIVEIGTFTGYATLCLAEGLAENGILHAIEANDELANFIKKYVEKAQIQEKVRLHIGEALKILPQLEAPIDLVFIDAAKREYADYYDALIDKMRIGGLIIADNVLWSGKVLEEKKDLDTQIIDAFNKKLAQDMRVETLLLPLRDGLMMARKIV
jgi:predicted O-methyltransferase YrrM